MEHIQNFIGGNLVPPTSEKFFDSINPAKGKPLAQVPDSDERDVALAVEKAQAAFPIWSSTP
ncbi:MAG: aldehyde dehydrogenase family protein, partial [Bacteroidota bacterium]